MVRSLVGRSFWFSSKVLPRNASISCVKHRNASDYSHFSDKSWKSLLQNPRYRLKFQPSHHHQYWFIPNVLEEVLLFPNAIFCTDFFVFTYKVLIRSKTHLSPVTLCPAQMSFTSENTLLSMTDN